MLKPISILPALALVALAFFVAGCGGGGGGDDSPTKAEFIKQAEAICTKSEEDIRRLVQDFGKKYGKSLKGTPISEIQETVARTITMPAILKQVEELETLELPAGDEKKLQKVFSETTAGAKKIKEEPVSVTSAGSKDPLQTSFNLARAYGLQYCAEL